MAGALSGFFDRFRGSGAHSVSVPPFDGALRPNELIETGELAATAPLPDNLCLTASGVAYSSGETLFRLDGTLLQRLPAPITALAAHAATLAVGLESGGVVIRGGPFDGRTILSLDGRVLNCPTAIAFRDAHTLIIANGSARNAPSHWKHDLLDGHNTGSVWQLDLPSGKSRCLADELAYPYGLLQLEDGGVLVSESWRHRLVRVAADQPLIVQLGNLPAYPARICSCAAGGVWVAMFAPRRRLVEFVLREPAYRKRMMAEIPSDYWIGPTLAPMASFLEPLQGGTLKQLARLKPWAPSRSYGLILRLDAKFQPVTSLHSRADGRRHGIRSVIEVADGLLAASAGANAIVMIKPGQGA